MCIKTTRSWCQFIKKHEYEKRENGVILLGNAVKPKYDLRHLIASPKGETLTDCAQGEYRTFRA